MIIFQTAKIGVGCLPSTGEFAPGHRNNYLVRLAMMLSDFGMEQQHAAQLMEKEYASLYGEESIPSLVKGCYKTAKPMHGRRALPNGKGKDGEGKKGDVKMQIAAKFLRNQGLKFDVITHKLKRSDMVDVTDRDINSMLLACNVESCQNISAQTFRPALMSNCIPEFNPLTDYLDEAVNAVTINPGDPSYIDQVADMVHVTNPAPPAPLAHLLPQMVCVDGGFVDGCQGGQPSDARAYRSAGYLQEHLA